MTASHEVRDMLQRQISWDENQPSKDNPRGLNFQFFQIDETTSSGKQLMHYRVYVYGVPENKKYTLTMWKIGLDPRVFFNEVYVNAKGLLMVKKPALEQENSDFVGDDELNLTVQAAQAEPVRYALVSSDKEILIYGTLVPFPREDTDRGCRLEVRRALPDATAVLVYAEGLPANTVVPFQLFTDDTQETRKFSVNAQGHAVTTEFHAANGKNRGSLKLTLAIPECSVAVEIPWGKGSYKLF
ncbi:MAG: hypothetical protein ABSC77_14455 [Terracidiphilus sp.]